MFEPEPDLIGRHLHQFRVPESALDKDEDLAGSKKDFSSPTACASALISN